MTVGELKSILDRSGLSDDAPVFMAVVDQKVRDGSRDVEAIQVEADAEIGLTMFLDSEDRPWGVCEVGLRPKVEG